MNSKQPTDLSIFPGGGPYMTSSEYRSLTEERSIPYPQLRRQRRYDATDMEGVEEHKSDKKRKVDDIYKK